MTRLHEMYRMSIAYDENEIEWARLKVWRVQLGRLITINILATFYDFSSNGQISDIYVCARLQFWLFGIKRFKEIARGKKV